MNILVLFSYGSLHSIDEVPAFYTNILGRHTTEDRIQSGYELYESHGKPDPLGATTYRIGNAIVRKLANETGEEWKFFVANRHAKPSIAAIALECAKREPKRVATMSLTPFDSLTGTIAYRKKFENNFRKNNDDAELLHLDAFYKNDLFIQAMTERAQAALDWLPRTVRNEAEIIFSAHSMPGTPQAHEQFIYQYKKLASQLAQNLGINKYHLTYRSGHPAPARWLGPDVLDVVDELSERNVRAVIFIEALSVIENLEVIQEISQDALNKARKLRIKAVQSEYLNDSSDFVEALFDHISKQLLYKNNENTAFH